MSRRARHRRTKSLLRLCLMALLSLGLALQPLLAAVGELHEFAHDPAGLHAVQDEGAQDENAQDEGAQDKNAQAPDAGGADDPSGLHQLLEFAHCCGQMPVSSLPSGAAATAFPLAGDRPQAEPQLPLQARVSSPFRPPIVA
ncbi:hypothetical protein [Luteimonas aquatica]|uniref:hypothetical protein n=1 Tax=Luteimonas aquatica TaxID=450364 RepID=UPI001F58AE8A|nr:hypothetical protein [Luteimonas aquatica]